MQLSVRTGLTGVAVGGGCVLLATVVGMSRPVSGPAAAESAAPAVASSQLTPGSSRSSGDLQIPEPSSVAAVSDRLLPNLRSLRPEDIEIRVADGRRQLWFTSIIANAGYGPAEVAPDGLRPCPAGQQHASQVLYRDSARDARFDRAADQKTTLRTGGCMLDHAGHEHWHFDAMARYSLTRPGERTAVVESTKVSFCLRDNRQTPSVSAVKVPKHYGDCGPKKVQGISPGWADVYDTDLPDQHLVLPASLPNGSYCLHNAADPLGKLLETDDTDNAAVIAVRITSNTAAVVSSRICS
jgi:hypothetical protein